MNNFQPINNGDSGLNARLKINNLGANALGDEHNSDTSAHHGFVARSRAGAKASENPYTAVETDNLGSSMGANIYGPNFAATKYIGAYMLDASRIKNIISKFGGSELAMPSYWGINLENSAGSSLYSDSAFFHAGLFVLSRNEESNNSQYPFKVVLFSGKDGVKKAYFKNGATPDLTAWTAIGGGGDISIENMVQPGEDFYLQPVNSIWTPAPNYNGDFFYGLALFNPGDTPQNRGILYYHVYVIDTICYHKQIFLHQGKVYTREAQTAFPPILVTNPWPTTPWQTLFVERFAIDNPTTGGIVKVTLNGGSPADYGKVPFLNIDGRFSNMVIPYATIYDQGGVKLAENTGNSTDAGKVFVADVDGKLPLAGLPSIPGMNERRKKEYLSNPGTYSIAANDNYEVYDLLITQANYNNISIKPPAIPTLDRRGKIKVRAQIKAPAGGQLELYDNYGPPALSFTLSNSGNPADLYIWSIIFEQFSPGRWTVLATKMWTSPGQDDFIND